MNKPFQKQSQHLQLNSQGQLQHLLSIEGLNKTLLTELLDKARSFFETDNAQKPTEQAVKKNSLLQGKTIVNLFFEPSTRTRTTFELAAKRLSADVLNISVDNSATTKGESLLDTIKNIQAMQCDAFVIRHADSGAAHFLAQHVSKNVSVINAGDGQHAHPTQALLDIYTIRQHKPEFQNLKIAIVGDILHSRVARSQIHALNILGAGDIRVVGPTTLIPNNIEDLGVSVYHDLNKGIKNTDVIMMLRLQKERMRGALLPSEQEYFECYGLTRERLKHAKADAIVMHPGPANRGVEIASDVADGSQSVILEQVTAGIAIRMAVLSTTITNRQKKS